MFGGETFKKKFLQLFFNKLSFVFLPGEDVCVVDNSFFDLLCPMV